jgi:hypothetical protein
LYLTVAIFSTPAVAGLAGVALGRLPVNVIQKALIPLLKVLVDAGVHATYSSVAGTFLALFCLLGSRVPLRETVLVLAVGVESVLAAQAARSMLTTCF